jgi:HrpA-like RNA helicase
MVPTMLVPGKMTQPALSTAGAEYITGWVRRRMPEFTSAPPGPHDRILVVKADTGSGKSTAMPVALARILKSERGPVRDTRPPDTRPGLPGSGAPLPAPRRPGVICTQPRVLTAVALARDVSVARSPWNPDMVLGQTVGYQTGPLSEAVSGGLTYATAGVLAEQLRTLTDPEMMALHRIIVVDEAHERSLDSDLLLMNLRAFYARNAGVAKLPFLILASATIDTAVYARYFGLPDQNVVVVEGRTFPIVTHWPRVGANDFVEAAADRVAALHANDDEPGRGDILVFLPGGREIAALGEALDARMPADRPWLALTLDRETVRRQRPHFRHLFAAWADLPPVGGRPPRRRVVMSTVVAETGLTIPTLKYVVDCGWSRSVEVYAPENARGLTTRPVARTRVEQRRGRCGRLFPGEFHPLYTEGVFRALDARQLPEIVTGDYASIHLRVLATAQREHPRGEFHFADLGRMMLDPPPPEAFVAASAIAFALGLADAGGLTGMGAVAARMPRASMEQARALLAGYVWGAAAADLLTAAAALNRQSLRRLMAGALPPPFQRDERTGALQDDLAEHVLVFDRFADALIAGAAPAWCAARGLSYPAMMGVVDTRTALAEAMLGAGLDPWRNHRQRLGGLTGAAFAAAALNLRRCWLDAHRHRLLTRRADGAYVSASGTVVGLLSGDVDAPLVVVDALVLRRDPKLMLYSVQALNAAEVGGPAGPGVDPDFMLAPASPPQPAGAPDEKAARALVAAYAAALESPDAALPRSPARAAS